MFISSAVWTSYSPALSPASSVLVVCSFVPLVWPLWLVALAPQCQRARLGDDAEAGDDDMTMMVIGRSVAQ